MIYAHDWKILGDRRVEHWSDGKRWKDARTLSVSITSFVGTAAIGAKHYDAWVHEEDNQWWSESEGDWVQLSCDTYNRGLSMSASCLTEKDAIKIAKAYIDILMKQPGVKYRISWSGPRRARSIRR